MQVEGSFGKDRGTQE